MAEHCSDLQPLSDIRPKRDAADERFLLETRNVPGTNEEHLAFYYQHKDAMRAILKTHKEQEIARALTLGLKDRADASLRRPFKKGARAPGGSSRADETHVGGVTGFGELFLKMLHEIEISILEDTQTSTQGLIVWNDTPSNVGEAIKVREFFATLYTERSARPAPPSLPSKGCLPRIQAVP